MKKIILSMLFFIVLLGCSRTELPAGTPAAAEPNVDGPAVTRSQAVLTADKYARVHWTLKEQNRVACGGNFVSRYSVGKRIGMAYKWSGWDDIETFLRKVKEGHGAGTGGG
ncbi:MAG: hypothetical protein GY757_01920, partial [bacterium]|nr:hypothetical protein [bacterium]